MENQGKATNDFGGKNGENSAHTHTHTHLAEGEIARGKCRAHVKGHAVRLETLTRGQLVCLVCGTSTNAHRLPLNRFGKFFFPSGDHQKENQKSQRKSLVHHEASKTRTHYHTNQRNKSREKALQVEAHRSNRRHRGIVVFFVVVVHRGMEEAFHRAKASREV